MTAAIKTGVCGWTDSTLLASGWYPAEVDDPESRLRYYAARFPLVENDATYYAPPAERQAELWASRTPRGFTMNVKAFAPFTLHHTDPLRLPKDLRESLTDEARAKRRAYAKDLGPEVLDELAARFGSALRPLRQVGKLGALLFQFPPWFAISRENKEHLMMKVKEWFPLDRIAVEFRNATWMSGRNREETLRFLAENSFAYVTVDEPQGFASSVPPVAAATTGLAMVRFHGRNAETWRKATQTAAERFKYKYTEEELADWVPRIKSLAGDADEVHVLMNNCYADYAVTNAQQMARMLS